MPYVLKTSEEKTVQLPREVIPHLGSAGENDLKVILYICSSYSENGFEDSDIVDIADKLSIDRRDADAAIAFWRGAGIIKRGKAPEKSAEKPKVPSQRAEEALYPAGQVAEAIENVSGMKNLVEFTQRRMGKLFNPSQLSTLYSFYDTLGFDTEVIMLAVEYCCGIEKKSLNYVQKVLITLSDNGVDSYTGAEEYFKRQRERRTNEGRIRTLCGISLRELTSAEKKIINTWFEEWKIDFSLIEKAYEITVDRTSKPSLKYMNAILADWNGRGVKSAEDIQKASVTPQTTQKSHDADVFFKAALAKGVKSGFGKEDDDKK